MMWLAVLVISGVMGVAVVVWEGVWCDLGSCG